MIHSLKSVVLILGFLAFNSCMVVVMQEEYQCSECQTCKMIGKGPNWKNAAKKRRVKIIKKYYCDETVVKKEKIIYGKGYVKYEFGIARPEIYHKIIYYSEEGKRDSVAVPNRNRFW